MSVVGPLNFTALFATIKFVFAIAPAYKLKSPPTDHMLLAYIYDHASESVPNDASSFTFGIIPELSILLVRVSVPFARTVRPTTLLAISSKLLFEMVPIVPDEPPTFVASVIVPF